MSSVAVPQPLTPDEYLVLEREATVRHEFVGGVMYVMAGGSRRHNLVAGRVAELLRAAGRREGCRTYQSDMKLETSDRRYYYPDVMVVCVPPPSDHDDIEREPCLVIEVLSASTRGVDTREKRAAYCSLDSLRGYLMIEPATGMVEMVHRGPGNRWVASSFGPGDTISLPCPDVVIAVDDLFVDVALDS